MAKHNFNGTFSVKAARNGHPLSDKGRAAMGMNTAEVSRKFGPDNRFGYTIKGLPVEYVPNHHACLEFGEARPDGKRSHHHATGFKWVPADTQSPEYLEAIEMIPRCMECRIVRWNKDVPCHYCAVKADPSFPSYLDDDKECG
jgi:hypothetical protein